MAGRRADLLLAVAILGVLLISILGTVHSEVVSVGGKSLGGACWMNEWLDILCPFCGMTRSFIALGHGELFLSLSYHPGGVLLFSLAIGLFSFIVWAAARNARPLCSRPRFLPLVQYVSLTCVGIGIVRTLAS